MTSENHEEDWAVYFCTVNEGEIGSALVDLGFAKVVRLSQNLIS
jgi:hypothetical protein